MNLLRRLLLGSGRLPDGLRTELVAEGVVLLEEGLAGSITLRNYRSPNRRSVWRKQATSGAVAVTARRFVVWAGGTKHVDVPLDHPLRAAVEVAVDRPDRVLVAYDAGRFDAARSGRVEVRLRTPHAARVAAAVGGTGTGPGPG